MERILAPRRILTFLALTATLTATGVAAAGFGEVDPALPAEFHPAQPLPGDKAQYAYSRIDAAGQSRNALEFLRFEVLPTQWTWNATGAAVLPRIVRVEEAGYQGYDPSSDERLPYRWGPAVSTAWLGTETPVWNEQVEVASQERPTGLDGTTTFTQESRGRSYGGAFIQSCLLAFLPPDYEPSQTVDMPFFVCGAGHGERHPDAADPTGRQYGNNRSSVQMVQQGVDSIVAVGQAMTDHGQAIVLESAWNGVLFWFVEAIPYPVQMVVPGDGFQTLHHLVSFQRGLEGPAPRPIGPFPAVRLAPAEPWGPSDAGVELPLNPSAAWDLALQDEGGELRSFLERHPRAYTERMSGGALPNEEGHAWTFQVRDGTDRIALEVRRGSWELPTGMWMPAAVLPETTVRRVEPSDIRDSDGTAPEQLPDLASAASRLRALTGLEPTRFEYSWGCNDWVHIGTCDGGSGPVVEASNDTRTTFQQLDPTAEDFLAEEDAYRTTTLTSRPDGRIKSLSESGTRFDESPPLVGSQSPEPNPATLSTTSVWQVPSTGAVATIGAAAGLLGLLYLVWPALKSGVVGLFSRTQDSEVLLQSSRRAVFDAIQARPGIHLHGLARFTGRGKGTVEHHLRKLVEHGQVVVGQGAGYSSYFPAGTDRRIVEAGPALRADSARDILRAIVAEPGSHGGHVAEVVGLNRGTVLHHVKRLQAAGLVTLQQDGGIGRLFPTTLAPKALSAA